MSTKITSRVWEHSEHRGTTLTVLLAIADQAHANGVGWPGVETLARMARIGERAVYNHLERLESSGELAIYRRQGMHNVYVVALGQTPEDQASAEKMIGDLFSGAELPATPARAITGTPEETIRGEESDTPEQTIRGTPEQTIRGPLNKDSPPPDQTITRSNTVVVGKKTDPDPDQQQQGAPARDPCAVERELFEQHRIAKNIWRRWMRHDPEHVVAAILHATQAGGVQNPVGLMRAMLERGTASPAPEYVRAAREKLGGKNPELDLDALEAAGWDPRVFYKGGSNGNGHA